MADILQTTPSPELVLSHLDNLPTLPAVAVRLLHVTALDDSSAQDVIKLVRNDQSLTAKILSVASSAAFGVRGPVTTLDKAVPLVGFSTVRTIVLATSVFDCFRKDPSEAPEGTFDQVEFWKHSLAVACAARRLAKLRPNMQLAPEDAFVAGLLHDLGKVALDTMFPKAYDRIAAQANHSRGDIADQERAILGADHTIAGRRLAERWRLPRDLQETVWLHHLASDALPTSVSKPNLIAIVQLADTLAREQRLGYSGNHVFYELSPRIAERLGYTPDEIASVVQPLAGDVAEQANILGLDGETAEAMFVKSMSRANAELGKLNAELLAGNRRLTAGARYFKAISEFEQNLTDWADPSAVVVALAKAGATGLRRERVAAFGLRDNRTVVDAYWTSIDPEDHGHLTTGVSGELLAWLDDSANTVESAILPAPPPVRSLLEESLSNEDSGEPWLLPIWHDGAIAGGLVYSSSIDERIQLKEELADLRPFLASLGLALGRANAQAAARRLSEDLAETNRRLQQMQAELLRSRTLSMIAEMAAGAGHELNTPLTVISGRAQMLGTSLDDPEAKRALQTISDKAHECSGIVSELMDFARPRPPKISHVTIEDLLSEARSAFLETGRLAASRIRLHPASTPRTTPASEREAPALVAVDAEQIGAVFVELITNAADAIAENDGIIVLRYQYALQPDTMEVLIEDTGYGMAPAVLQRAFDPFYSHRHAGRRRGLGLPRAYRIIEAHGGRIWLESRPDEGTTVHVLLPRAPGI